MAGTFRLTDDTPKNILVGFKGIPVFRYEDTDGMPLDVYEPRELPPLTNVAEKWGIKVSYSGSIEGEYGSFNTKSGNINLCTEDAVTFFHELTHAAHLKLDGSLKGGQDPEQEAIAQLTACTLGSIYGIDAKDYSWNYIASYAEDKTPEAVGRMCLRVLNKVQQILAMILEEEEPVSEESVSEEKPVEVAA